MDVILKILVFALLLIFIFCGAYFTNKAVYWSLYGIAFVLLVLLWITMFWVSKKRAQKILGQEFDFDIFCGKVPNNVTMDLTRGRFCVCKDKIYLVSKVNGKYKIDWEKPINEITSVSFGKVAGVRKGFSVHYGDYSTDFVCDRIKKHKTELFKALGWEIKNV